MENQVHTQLLCFGQTNEAIFTMNQKVLEAIFTMNQKVLQSWARTHSSLISLTLSLTFSLLESSFLYEEDSLALETEEAWEFLSLDSLKIFPLKTNSQYQSTCLIYTRHYKKTLCIYNLTDLTNLLPSLAGMARLLKHLDQSQQAS